MTVAVLVARAFEPAPMAAAGWLARLPAQRRAQIEAMAEPQARHRSLIGSRLLALGLQALGFGDDALASLRYPPRGRPVLDLPVDFSLSHGGRMVLCAVSTAGPVGVDVEGLEGLSAGEFVHYLDAGERRRAGRDAAAFLAIWTSKEAVAKAAGGAGLRDVPRVATQADGRTALLDGRTWHTLPVPLDAAHVARLALGTLPAAAPRTIEPSRALLEDGNSSIDTL